MRHLSQKIKNGKLGIDNVVNPEAHNGELLVQTSYSLISAGTERTKIETGKMSLAGKALSRPDQVKQVLQSVQQTGLLPTFEKVMTRLNARSPLGYSSAGVVIDVGEGVSDFRVGDRVACAGASAAHAEIITVPLNLCAHVPENVKLDWAAFTTVGAIALQGIRQADIRLGETVVVLGLGLLGQLTVQMLRASGCTVIGFDPNQARCKLAMELGVNSASNREEEIRSFLLRDTANKGADAVILTADTSSNRPVEFAGEICRDKGRVVVVGAVGLTIPRAPYYEKELDLRLSRSYGPGRYDINYEEKGHDYPYGFVRWTEKRNMEAFLKLLDGGKVNVEKLITHRFKLEQAEEAYELISGKRDETFLGVLYEYEPEKVTKATIISSRKHSPVKEGKVGVGVIGAGNFAQSMLLPHLKSSSTTALLGVATLSPLQTKDVVEKFDFEYAASSEKEILNDERIKGVIIATRHDSHATLVTEALRKEKSIHVEKPLAMNLKELDQIVAQYNKSSKSFLMVGFNRRFSPFVKQIKEFLVPSSEPFAMTYRINAGYIPLDHWTQDTEQGGGRIIGEVCHFIDLLQFIAGSRVKSIYAKALPNLEKYQNDNCVIIVEMEDDSLGNILYTANGNKSLHKEYLEVYNGGKIAVLDDFHALDLFDGRKHISKHISGQDKGHKNEMQEWVNAIKDGRHEPVPFLDSVVATKASFAVVESIASGEVVVIE
jgi:polar amino acid transport system substrate-binding protein